MHLVEMVPSLVRIAIGCIGNSDERQQLAIVTFA
jgi:hypothetical protein